jgi:transketolase
MPCWELFLEQSREYQETVLPATCRKRVSLEAGATTGWHKFIGLEGLAIGLDTFGASGKAEDLALAFGFTPEKVIERIQSHFSEGV